MGRADRVGPRDQEIARESPSVRGDWPAFAACAWSLLFGAVHLYWVLGGGAGLPPDVVLRDKTALLIVDVAAIPLCVIGALLALALAGGWGRRLPRRWLLAAGWSVTAVCLTHSVPTILADLALAFRLRSVELTANDRYIMYLYEPWFFTGGVAFAAATWLYQRRTPAQSP